MPVLITLWGFLFAPVLFTVVSVINSSVVGFLITFGACKNTSNYGKDGWLFAPIFKTLIFRLLNKFWCSLRLYFFDVCLLSCLQFFNQIISNFVVYGQICGLVGKIISDFVVYCQICEFFDHIQTLVSLWTKYINCGVIWFCLLFQHYFINRLSNTCVG